MSQGILMAHLSYGLLLHKTESLRQYTQRQLGEFKKEVEARGRRSSL